MYFDSPVLTRERAPRPREFATGTRDNVRAFTAGPQIVGGKLALPISADEIIELLLMGVQGSVTPTTPTGATLGRLWTFKPGTVLDSGTVEWDDGARPWQAAGCHVDQLSIKGAVKGENTVDATLFGTALVQNALTGALTDRVPTFMEGWQTRLWLDAFAGTPGFTPIPATLINWDVTIKNNLGRKFTADNVLYPSAIPFGKVEIEAKLTIEASTARALTEFNNWDALTKRLLRLEFLSAAAEIEAGVNEVQSLIATSASSGTFTLSFRGQTTGTIAYNATAATVQTALRALSTIGATGVTCTLGALPGTAIVITFGGTLAGQDVPLITADNTSLVGGTAVITTTTPGYFGGRYVTVDIPGAWTAVDLSGEDEMTRVYELGLTYVYDPTNAMSVQVRAQNSRATAY